MLHLESEVIILHKELDAKNELIKAQSKRIELLENDLTTFKTLVELKPVKKGETKIDDKSTTKQVDKQKVEDDLLTEFQSYDKDLRILTYKVLLEKFNGKYASLNDNQKEVLKEFINSVDSTPKLKDFYNTKIQEIKTEITELSKGVSNKAVQIKLNEVNNLLSPLSKIDKVGNDDLVNLLQYYELLEELKNVAK